MGYFAHIEETNIVGMGKFVIIRADDIDEVAVSR